MRVREQLSGLASDRRFKLKKRDWLECNRVLDWNHADCARTICLGNDVLCANRFG
jgi:hypothetical protein